MGVATVVLKKEEEEEVQYSGGGIGNRRKIGGGNGGGDQNENRRIDDYYQGMLKADPGSPLLLRNYERFLHEVRKKTNPISHKNSSFFSSLILLSISLFSINSISSTFLSNKGGGRREGAEEYYSRAILASPGDGEVLSLYGKLVWETHGDGARAEACFNPSTCLLIPPDRS